MLICSIGIVLDDQQAFLARLGEFLDARERLVDAFARGRLVDEGEGAARETVLAVLVERDDLYRDMPGERILLELAEHVPAQHVGQEHVERHRGRLILLGEIERIVAAHRQQRLEALVARQIDQDARVMRIVLDDQQDGVAGLEMSMRSSGIGSTLRSRHDMESRLMLGAAPPRPPSPPASGRSAGTDIGLIGR